MPYVGQLGAVGLAKETVLGTFVTPTRFIPVHLPCNIGAPDIDLLKSKGVTSTPDLVRKVAQGAASLKSGKMKFDVEPENCGEIIMAGMGTDTMAEVAGLVVGASNNKINFKEDAGATLTATVDSGTYVMGTTSGTVGTLCAKIKSALEAAPSATGTYTVTYSRTTNKVTITKNSGTIQILWATGANTAIACRAVLGWTAADTAAALAITSDSTVLIAMKHTFTRLAAAQLPTYSLWTKNGLNYPGFAGAMMNKLDFDVKANEFLTCEADWAASLYDADETRTISYSSINPFKFNQAVITVAGGAVTSYADMKLSINNAVKIKPVCGGSIYSNVIYSEYMEVSFGATIVVENSTEWDKFVAGTSTSFIVAFTHSSLIGITNQYHGLTFNLPELNYAAAPIPLPNGLLEVSFQAQGVYNVSGTKTVDIELTNGVSTTY